ncbi:hypothetical protein B0H12DRAFT_1323394 [Mycena haematopus]|nr:hypothetical protein B0H12DRAFT_1323394 [Mycena haematopus]
MESQESALSVVGLRDLQVTRLVSAGGLVILLYDHLLSLPDEVRLIWPARLTSSKVLFLGMRYIVPCIMIAHTAQLSGLASIFLSDRVCKSWYIISILIGWLALGINDWLVLLRVWVIWDRNRTFILCTLLMFVASNITVLVLSGLDFAQVLPIMHFEPLVHICALEGAASLRPLRILWLPGLSFQSAMILSMAWKVLTCPHTRNSLIRDGYLYFMLLYVINLLNVILLLTVRPTLMLVMAFLMWCLTTTTTCRMILSLRHSGSPDLSDDQDEDTYGGQSATHLELAWVGEQSLSTADPAPTPRSTFNDSRTSYT